MQFCDVLIQESFLYNTPLTYSADGYHLEKGMRVFVHVKGRKMVGFVLKVYEGSLQDFEYKILPIDSQIDTSPIINDELYDLAFKMSHMNLSPLIRVFQTILPNSLRPRTTFKKPKEIQGLTFNKLDDEKLTPKQASFIEKFKAQDFVLLKDARTFYSGYDTLVKRDIFKKVSQEARYVSQSIENTYPELPLTPEQQSIKDKIDLNKAHTYLLHGVTGSGKTEVYLHLAKDVLKRGKSVLFLVPEIALTPQMIQRVSERFGEDVAIYHSGLNEQEKYEQYIRVKNHETFIVVGTRSALFMPFDNLGLIVLDEEHDTSYKQTSTPSYHALDVATLRSETHQCPLILGSASPRLESYARALKGVYTLLELPRRINDNFPKVTIIDTKDSLYQGEGSILTSPLMNAIQKRLDQKEQVILLLNRRGYMTFLKDKKTDQVLMCPHCDISLNYHKHDRMLKCHQCDYHTNQIPLGEDGLPLELVGSGVGTQRLVEGLQSHFKTARIVRMDRDTTTRKNAHEKILTDFSNHKYDILVGTQMIAKGLDIENVTLVGIVNIDHTLAYEDFRSVEHTFNLILQATGRSGRGDKEGEVMIQTFNKDHYAIYYGVHNQYKRFFNQEMKYRKLAKYPPYSYLIAITFTHQDENVALKHANTFLNVLKRDKMIIMGPTSLVKLSDLRRVRIILKGVDLKGMLEDINHAVTLYYTIHKGGISVDVNPLTLI